MNTQQNTGVLSQQALNFIRSKGNGLLYGQIADTLGVSGTALKDVLNANKDERLAGDDILELIRERIKELQDMEIIANNQAAA